MKLECKQIKHSRLLRRLHNTPIRRMLPHSRRKRQHAAQPKMQRRQEAKRGLQMSARRLNERPLSGPSKLRVRERDWRAANVVDVLFLQLSQKCHGTPTLGFSR